MYCRQPIHNTKGQKMGVKNAKRWTEEENQRLRDNYQLSKADLLNLFPDRSPAAVNIQACKLGLRKEHNEYCKSECGILLQESLEAYYWIGFILADGHISNQFRLIVTLAIVDIEHLRKLADFLSVENIRTEKNTQVTIAVQDKLWLKKVKEKFDIKNDKTYYPPNLDWIIDDNLFLAMLVGYIDGDGCIKHQTNRKDTSISIHIHSSWLPFLEMIKRRIETIFVYSTGKPIIGKDGYARYTISNFPLLKQLKVFTVDNNLPILERKWSRIDLSYISRKEIYRDRIIRIKELHSKGFSSIEISKILGFSVNTIMSRNNMKSNRKKRNENQSISRESIC